MLTILNRGGGGGGMGEDGGEASGGVGRGGILMVEISSDM